MSTTLEVLAERTRTAYRERNWRRTLQDHTIICGFGVKGRTAVETLLAHGQEPGSFVVIDEHGAAIEEAKRSGYAGVIGDASSSAVLEAAGVRDAAAVVVAPDRDDSAVLITLTARELNPRARIVASVREEENAHLLRQGGADSVVVSSGAAGRLLGHAIKSPRIVAVLEDLLSVGEGLDITEREVGRRAVRQAARQLRDRRAGHRRRARTGRAALRRPRDRRARARRQAGLPLHQPLADPERRANRCADPGGTARDLVMGEAQRAPAG